jgi:adenylate cyclase
MGRTAGRLVCGGGGPVVKAGNWRTARPASGQPGPLARGGDRRICLARSVPAFGLGGAMREESPICATIATARAEGLPDDALERRVWERHGTTCAMLALDSSGMTRISRSLGIVHFLSRYMLMRDVAGAVLERHRCLGWRSFADNLFAEFTDADGALAAAGEIHAGLRAARIMLTATEPYRVCIGIGHGRVLANGPLGVMGDEMNLTAKLAEDIAEAGDTLLTESAYRRLTAAAAPAAQPLTHMLSQLSVTFYRLRQ